MKTNAYFLKINKNLTISGSYDYEGENNHAKVIVEFYLCELVKRNPQLASDDKKLIKTINKLLNENNYNILVDDILIAKDFKPEEELITTTK